MDTQYSCKKPQRRAVVLETTSGGNPVLNGIDYVEVSADQKTLKVTFLFPLPGQTDGVPASPDLTSDNIVIEGGRVRIDRSVAGWPPRLAALVFHLLAHPFGWPPAPRSVKARRKKASGWKAPGAPRPLDWSPR